MYPLTNLDDSVISTSAPLPSPSPLSFHIADTGATAHFGNLDTPCHHKAPTPFGITALLPNNARMQATHTGLLPLYQLPKTARTTNLFTNMREPLLSIGVLCDHGCTATFRARDVVVTKDDQHILTGHREPSTGLWKIPLPLSSEPPPHSPAPLPAALARVNQVATPPQYDYPIAHLQMNSAYHQPNNTALVRFLHAAAGSPVPSTWIRAIQAGHYATWPGLTPELVRKYLPPSPATAKGHLDQQRQNLRSTHPPADTKIKLSAPQPDHVPSRSPPTLADTDTQPFQENPNIRTHQIFASCHDVTGQIASDLTGRFPTVSYQGHKYILVIYDYDSNSIIVEAMKNRSAQEHLRAYNKLHQYLCARGFRPVLQRLDNEASALLKSQMREHGVDYQLVQPHMHRRNAAEHAICTFKKHFIAILATADPNFPLRLWPELLPQTILTLNLLRSSRLNPRLPRRRPHVSQ
jgi:hypothetical protein